ncbi:iron ABC transporter permease, partial [Streptomyces globisporus]
MSTRTTTAPPAPVKTGAGAAGPAGAVSPAAAGPPARRGRMFLLGLAGLLALGALALTHVSQGTAAVDLHTLWNLATGSSSDRTAHEQTAAVVLDSRLPRLAAGLLVGCALGAAGAALQSVSRNMLASPDTLAVNAGAYFAVVTVAAFGITLPALPAGATAFLGGLIAAAVVLGLSRAGAGPIRLVLAGSALTLALSGLSGTMLLLRSQQTTGLFAWGEGSLAQIGMQSIDRLTPVALVAFAGLMLMGRRLDILALGDDGAAVVGVSPRLTRSIAVTLAVLLAAVSVAVAGPVGFVGLCAPAAVRLLSTWIPGLVRHRAFLPASALAGVLVVLGADVLLRAVFGAQAGAEVPTGIVTTCFGALVLIVLAYRSRDMGTDSGSTAFSRLRSRRAFVLTLVVTVVGLVGAVVVATLFGDATLLLGDVGNWLAGRSGQFVSYVLDTRVPRVAAALLAGAALAVAGTAVQAVSRNPLAEPGVLGVVSGAGVGAVTVLTVVPLASFWLIGGS